MRRLNDMFHIDGERLVKTSNGEPVPDDEPVFILRARDDAAPMTLLHYIHTCRHMGTPDDRLEGLKAVSQNFEDWRGTHRTKIPGTTHGK